MISTSSSECECTGRYSFGPTVPNIVRNPFCPTGRQPLIYFARIQEPLHLQPNRGNIKDDSNNNCFMKAFQWYTQERGSGYTNEIADSKVNNSDFAEWLDKKYNEYLKRNKHGGSGLILKQSPTPQADKMSKKQKSSRKFGRMRSPWKRRRQTNSKEKGDFPPINQSVEFILEPQDLPKLPSECCQRNSHIQSSTTIISKESPKYTKIKVKSKSLLSIYRAQEVCGAKETKTKSRAKTICECLKTDKETQYETFSLESLTTSRNYNSRTPGDAAMCDVITKQYTPERFSESNVLCQCSNVNFYEADGTTPLRKYTTQQDSHTNKKNSKNQAYNCKMLKSGVMFTGKPNIEGTKIQNCCAQTSDHSINFGNIKYEPLLLKIVHANK